MPASIQNSRNRPSDHDRGQQLHGRNYRPESTSTSQKSDADSKAYSHRVSYSQATVHGSSTSPMRSASTAARQGTTSCLQMNDPRGLIQATSGSSTTQSTTSRQHNTGTDGTAERQSMRNGSVANPIPHQVDTRPAEYQIRYVENHIRRQHDATYSPTENSLVESDSAPRPRVSSL